MTTSAAVKIGTQTHYIDRSELEQFLKMLRACDVSEFRGFNIDVSFSETPSIVQLPPLDPLEAIAKREAKEVRGDDGLTDEEAIMMYSSSRP